MADTFYMHGKVYSQLATAIGAIARCKASGNAEWEGRWETVIDRLMEGAPSGSGIDNGTKLDMDRSGDDKIVLTAGFHHMNEGGCYDGWTEHTITVLPSLSMGFTVRVSGRDRNGIKEYLADTYHAWLNENVSRKPVPVE